MRPLNSARIGRLQARFTAAALAAAPLVSIAAAPTSAPQVLLAITNSESMDGTTGGAIMVGSGGLPSANSSLTSSSSPTSYTIPSGFTPPLNAGSSGSAPYTVTCNTSYQCDNGPSRMNFTKAAITQVIGAYASSLNFGLYVYNTGSPTLYNTWVYYMSPSGSGFTFTNTASSTTVGNPCYGYGSASSSVSSTCASIARQYSVSIGNYAYMNVGASSDNPLINDVLYYTGNTIGATLLTYGTVSPSNPYTYYSLSTYNTNLGSYVTNYSSTAPNVGQWGTTPTNAGYVPYSPQVMYAERGFGYGASQSATTGTVAVAMGTDPTTTAFTNALLPETSNPSSSEIKSVAGQSGTYALMNGAKTYLASLSKATCQGQYVVLLTDGLPTLDKSGSAWPPLGTTTANAYNLSATFNADGSFASSNSQALTDAITSIKALATAGIKVYVIGLGAGVSGATNAVAAQILQAMAIAGGTTSYYPATSASALNLAFSTIINQIYTSSSLAAPVAPISVSSGAAYEYELTSNTSPVSGHVRAYATASNGTVSTTASWDAATLMTTANRAANLLSTKSDNTVVTLANVDTAAFGLTVGACVPNVATIIAYTVNPNYSYNSCSYLAGRDPASLLGAFSTQDTGRYVGPPASSQLTSLSNSYVTYARTASGRTPMLMFSDQDGFIYAVNASTGALMWGWISRNLLPNLQNYGTFPAAGYTNGGFTVADATDATGTWASYLVGSLQSGAEHFSVKLNANGTPATTVYDSVIAGAAAAGDKAGTTGATPLRQPPIVAYINGSVYQVYVVTIGTISTLYETNVATGATTASLLAFQVSSALTLDNSSNQLYVGGANGSLWVGTLSSGTALTDAASLRQIGTTVNPSTGNALSNVLYIGIVELSGVPYLYAANSAQVTMFTVTSSGWTPIWASTPSAGWSYSGTAWASSSTVSTLTTGSVVSDFPAVLGKTLIVPTFVPGSGCNTGTGYYDFYGFANGAFPGSTNLMQNGVLITADISVGPGPAFTPSLTLISGGVAANPGNQGSTTPGTAITQSGTSANKPISWQQR